MMNTINQSKYAINEFAQKLQQGTRLKQEIVVEIMTDAYGRSANGKWSWKGATDTIEAAMVKLLLHSPAKSLEELRELQRLVPHHQVRSTEQMQLQQFSSPLELAWLVSTAAAITSDDTILEPSAGTGILPALAINQLGLTPQLILNEISKSRKELLHQLYPHQLGC